MGFKRIILATIFSAAVLSPALAAPAPQKLADAFARPARLQGRTYDLQRILDDVNIRRRLPAIDVNTIRFGSASARISPQEQKKLAGIAAAMRLLLHRNPREIFLIEGHTDKAGRASYNLKLSEARARAVREALVRNFGIPAANLVAKGYGEAYPRILGKVREPRNRRVVFRRITDALKRPPMAAATRTGPAAAGQAPFRPRLMRRQALPFTPPAARPPFLAPEPVAKPRPAPVKPAFRPWLMRTGALPFTPPAARPPFLAPAPKVMAHAGKPCPTQALRNFRPRLVHTKTLPFIPPAARPPFLAPAPVAKPRPAPAKPAFRPWLMRTGALPFTPPAARPPFLAPAPKVMAHAGKPCPTQALRNFRPRLVRTSFLPFTPPAAHPPFLTPAPLAKPRPAQVKAAFRPWLMRTSSLPFTPPAARPPFLAPRPAARPRSAPSRPAPAFRPWLKVRARLPFTPPAGCPLP